jgi:glycosyltransferase involved in cell wall biosynthesis
LTDFSTDAKTILEQLESACQLIGAGERLGSSQLIRLLSYESAAHRFLVNQSLAKAYFHYAKNPEAAAIFAERALGLSGLSEDFFAFYIELHAATGNVEAQRSAYKTMGMRYAAAGDSYSALRNFNLHRDAYALAGLGDRYQYDFDVLAAINRLAIIDCGKPSNIRTRNRRRIRLAYLVFHIHHQDSVIVKLLGEFAQWHNKLAFEVTFFVVESNKNNNEIALKNLDILIQAGARIVQADKSGVMSCLHQTARHIRGFRPDILIGTAILADYAHYYAASTSPAIARIGLAYGPPELYIAPNLDWVVTSTKTLLVDSPVSGSVIPVQYKLPTRHSLLPPSRSALGVADDAVILASAGRPSKFMDQGFWTAILQTLEACPNTFFIAMGLDVDPPFLADLIPETLKHRVIRLGWRSNYLSTLAIADIVIDTYPSGGGMVLVDAMAFSIPVVSFNHDYTKPYDQMNWNLGEEVVYIPELVVDRYNLDGLKTKLASLIQDPGLRIKLGAACHAVAHGQRGSPERYVRQHEETYKNVLAHKLEEAALGPKIKKFSRSIARRVFAKLNRLRANN